MARMSLAELSAADRALLLAVARRSIWHGLDTNSPLPVDPADYPATLSPLRATFVTLELGGELRGCIGTLEAQHPLVQDVAEHAYAAAFADPRFPRLDPAELPELAIHIAVLSPPEPLPVSSEADLLQKLRPGVDGVILCLGKRRATFLPTVWQSLPNPRDFIAHLKYKALLPLDFWSDAITVARYTTESFP